MQLFLLFKFVVIYIIINIYIMLSFSSGMKYAQEPKPVEYDSLTIDLLEKQGKDLMRQGQGWMGPVSFRVSPASHEKTVSLLNQNTTSKPQEYPCLLPSEFWGCARVLSNYFGRLNEVAVSRTKWEFKSTAYPGNQLYAISRILSTERRKGLSYATIETLTYSIDEESNNQVDKMRQLDELLLLHEASENFYREREVRDDTKVDMEIPRTVYFRYNWNNGLWLNNIHTDDYARRFGYERGLPEFIMYMDWMFDAVVRKKGMYVVGVTIDVPLILPVYEGDKVTVKIRDEGKNHEVRFAKNNVLRLKGNIEVNR